jgi:hypothetical protein
LCCRAHGRTFTTTPAPNVKGGDDDPSVWFASKSIIFSSIMDLAFIRFSLPPPPPPRAPRAGWWSHWSSSIGRMTPSEWVSEWVSAPVPRQRQPTHVKRIGCNWATRNWQDKYNLLLLLLQLTEYDKMKEIFWFFLI